MRSTEIVMIPSMEERLMRVRRFLLAGNAGGAVACLRFIGTVIASRLVDDIAKPLFWVLVIFLIGVLGSWYDMVGEVFSLGKFLAKPIAPEDSSFWEKQASSQQKEEYEAAILNWRERYRASWMVQSIAVSISSIFLIVGTIFGLVALYDVVSSVGIS